MKQNISTVSTRFKRALVLRLLVAGMALLMLAACAATPQAPQREISAAEQAMTDAEQARVAEYALPELQEARKKLSAARTAVQKEQMDVAKRMAEQASLDISLAVAKSDLAKAQLINHEMEENIDVLKQEMHRNTGAEQ